MDESSLPDAQPSPAGPITKTQDSGVEPPTPAEPTKANKAAKPFDLQQALADLQQTFAADSSKPGGAGYESSDAGQKAAPLSSKADKADGGRNLLYEKIMAFSALVAAIAAIAAAIANIYTVRSMESSARQDEKWKSEESRKLDAVYAEVQKNFNESQKFEQESLLLQRSSATSLDKTAEQVKKLAGTYQGNSPNIAMVEGATLGGLPLSLTNGRYEVSSFSGCPSLGVKLRGPSRGGNLKVEGGMGGRIFSCSEEPLRGHIEPGAARDLSFDLGDCLRSEGITECDGNGWLTVRVTR